MYKPMCCLNFSYIDTHFQQENIKVNVLYAHAGTSVLTTNQISTYVFSMYIEMYAYTYIYIKDQ